MKLFVGVVYDSAVGAYLQPFFSRSKLDAMRSFYNVVTDEKMDFAKFAKDYTLMHAGFWDDQTGLFENNPTPLAVISALEVLSAYRNGPAS